MGNKSKESNKNSSSNKKFDGLTPEEFDSLVSGVNLYINNRGVKLEEILTEKEIELIKNTMVR